MVKPHLKKKYHNLCHISMSISTKLFNDDVTKDIKIVTRVCLLQKRIIPLITNLIEVEVYLEELFSGGMRGVNRYHPYPQNMQ